MLTEAQRFWDAIKNKVLQICRAETKNTLRMERYTVTTAPDGAVIGVTLPYGTTELMLPYSKEVAEASVGDVVLVAWWGSMSNAKVYYFANGYEGSSGGGGGGGTSNYADLSNKPQINGVTLAGNKTVAQLGLGTYTKPSGGIPATDIAAGVIPSPSSATPQNLGTAAAGSSTDYSRADHVHDKPTYTKSDVGLGNVDNVQQYSASNPPPYPVTSVNGQTGDVTITIPSSTPVVDTAQIDTTQFSGTITFTKIGKLVIAGGSLAKKSVALSANTGYTIMDMWDAPFKNTYGRIDAGARTSGSVAGIISVNAPQVDVNEDPRTPKNLTFKLTNQVASGTAMNAYFQITYFTND